MDVGQRDYHRVQLPDHTLRVQGISYFAPPSIRSHHLGGHRLRDRAR